MPRIPEVQDLMHAVQHEPPQSLNGYKLTRVIGQSHDTVVFEATVDIYGNKKFAVKLPIIEKARSLMRARQRILSALGQSPYSIDIEGEGTFKRDIPYSAEGFRPESLADVIAKNAADEELPTADAIIELGKQLLQGADWFHNIREKQPDAADNLELDCLCHAAINAENIRMSIDQRQGRIQWEYTDFGILFGDRIDGKPEIKSALSIESLQGSDIYAAPEVQQALLRGLPVPVTVASDLYSIGACLWAYATGKTPGLGSTDITAERSDLKQLDDFFKTVLSGNPESRYQSAEEALKALKAGAKKRKAKPLKTDSYIFGLTRSNDGKYKIFRQGMDGPHQVNDYKEIMFDAMDAPVPEMFYVPDIQSVLVLTASRRGNETLLNAALYNKDMEKTAEHSLDRVSPSGRIKDVKYQVARKKDNGQLALTVSITTDSIPSIKAAYNLPSLDTHHISFRDVDTGWLYDWQKVKQPRKYYGIENWKLKIRKGIPICCSFDRPKREVSGLDYVVSAVWIQ